MNSLIDNFFVACELYLRNK